MENRQVKPNKGSFVKGAAILAIAGLLCKIIGAFFRVPLYNLLGDGMAYYEAVYPFYSALLVVSTSGVPSAISRMVAECVAVNDYAGAKRVFRKAQLLLLIIGFVSAAFLFFGAERLSMSVKVGEGAKYAFRALAPAVLFVSFMCSYRGYLQGLQRMTGTAVSQLIEQAVKLIAGLILAGILLPKGPEFGAMGALLGIGLSEFLAMAVIALFYRRTQKTLVCSVSADAAIAARNEHRNEHIIGDLLAIAVPVTIGGCIMPITGIIDSNLIVSTLLKIGFTLEEANMRFVALRTNVTTIINMPAVITIALCMSLIPAVGAARKRNDMDEVKSLSVTGIKFATIVGFPCAAGLFVVGGTVIDFLYDITPDRLIIATELMRIASVGVAFLSLVQTLTGIIQGMGKQYVPVINLAIGAVVKVVLMLTVMRIPSVNINGAALSTMMCYVIAGTLDFIYLIRLTGIKPNWFDLIGKPLIAAVIMAFAVWGIDTVAGKFVPSAAVRTLFAVGGGIVIYLLLAIVLRFFNEEDLERLPGGNKLKKILLGKR